MTPEDRNWCDNVVVAGSHPSKYATWAIVERIVAEGIEGDFAEAGVGGGGHIAVMSRALEKHGRRRTIHAFDSFEGIPKATAEDDEAQRAEYGVRAEGEPLASSGKIVARLDQFKANMKRWEVASHIEVCRGWFQTTFEHFSNAHLSPFDAWAYDTSFLALLRIDVDLVRSVDLCMRWLYPFVREGGYVLFDDWGLEDCATRREMRRWYDGPVTEVDANPGLVWWKKP